MVDEIEPFYNHTGITGMAQKYRAAEQKKELRLKSKVHSSDGRVFLVAYMVCTLIKQEKRTNTYNYAWAPLDLNRFMEGASLHDEEQNRRKKK